MPVKEQTYIRVVDRAAELGCNMPTGIAIMPDNFDVALSRADLVVRGESSTIRTLLRNNGLSLDDFLPSGERPRFIHNKSHDWGAFLFIGAALLSTDPNAVSVALGVISNYLTEMFRGDPSGKIKLDVTVERKGDRLCKMKATLRAYQC
ncbi:MAG: hypothetical protein JSR91_14020 [Proteobacteria bacterium]|nr:hypothetical protein [Pseudomonadota bacterium]